MGEDVFPSFNDVALFPQKNVRLHIIICLVIIDLLWKGRNMVELRIQSIMLHRIWFNKVTLPRKLDLCILLYIDVINKGVVWLQKYDEFHEAKKWKLQQLIMDWSIWEVVVSNVTKGWIIGMP